MNNMEEKSVPAAVAAPQPPPNPPTPTANPQ